MRKIACPVNAPLRREVVVLGSKKAMYGVEGTARSMGVKVE